MSNDILQIINLLILLGLISAVFVLVRNSGKSAKALEDIAKTLAEKK